MVATVYGFLGGRWQSSHCEGADECFARHTTLLLHHRDIRPDLYEDHNLFVPVRLVTATEVQ